jgi:hypothetical protein
MSKRSNHRPEPEHYSVHGGYIPYWKRAHSDWRFWVGVMLMFVAMIIYVMSGDLALRPGTRPRQPMPADVGQ